MAEKRDLDAVVALRAEMFGTMGVPAGSGEWRLNGRAWFADRLDNPRLPDHRCGSGRLGGLMRAGHDPRCGSFSVGAMWVATYWSTTSAPLPQLAGAGHGRAAFDAVMGWAQASAVGRAELLATVDGRAMYERAGFKETGHSVMRADLRA